MNKTFEHVFVPEIVENSNHDSFELDIVEIFDDFEFTVGCFEDKFPDESKKMDWKNFKIIKQMTSDLTFWLLLFSEPQSENDSKWGLIIKKAKKPFVYFTFEKSCDDRYTLCYYKNNVRNCGSTFDAATTEQQFIDEAYALYASL